MVTVALGKHERAVVRMLSEKSAVTSLTFSRRADGILFNTLTTSSVFVPLAAATTLPFPHWSVPGGQNGWQVMAQHRRVKAQPPADVLRRQHPLSGMRLLHPSVADRAQDFLVVPLQRLPVDLKERLQRTGRYGVRIQIFF